MSLEQDVAAARRAVEALEQACAPVARRFGDTVDARRLRVDLARVRDDLTLLCGTDPHARWRDRRPYETAGWDDGFDDLGAPGRTAP